MHILSFFLMAIMVAKGTSQDWPWPCNGSRFSRSTLEYYAIRTSTVCNPCKESFRLPEYTDISVECGTSYIYLSILYCPCVYAGYNESLLILNGDPTCQGTLDTSVTPPVVRFHFPLTMANSCGSVFRTTSTAGTGIFSDFSNIQTVNISGIVRSDDPTSGTVTYNTELKYYYSCAYPLEYLINNTQIDVSASSIAVKDTNGSFISTLRLELFSDSNYTKPLPIPSAGIELRTNVYAQVSATNLTSQYNVLLDRCYASISAHPTDSSFFNLFVPCNIESMTTMIENGESHAARFSFPAFRFLEQQHELVSTYYLHCITRLCDIGICSAFMQCSANTGRRRRSAQADESAVTKVHTLTSPEIITKTLILSSKEEPVNGSNNADSSTGLGVAVGILAFACIIVLCVAAVLYKKLKAGILA